MYVSSYILDETSSRSTVGLSGTGLGYVSSKSLNDTSPGSAMGLSGTAGYVSSMSRNETSPGSAVGLEGAVEMGLLASIGRWAWKKGEVIKTTVT